MFYDQSNFTLDLEDRHTISPSIIQLLMLALALEIQRIIYSLAAKSPIAQVCEVDDVKAFFIQEVIEDQISFAREHPSRCVTREIAPVFKKEIAVFVFFFNFDFN